VTNRIFFKLLLMFAFVVLVTAVTLDVSIRRAWESSLRDEIQRSLTARTRLFANRVEIDRTTHSLQDIAAQEGQAAGARATIIDPTGRFSPTLKPIRLPWKIIFSVRNLRQPLAEILESTSAAAVPLAFLSSTLLCPFQEARCAWHIRFPTSTPHHSVSITHC